LSAAAKILARLSGVKQTAPDRWIAQCPAHKDRSPSLSIREVDDGRVLLHCFAECSAIDVLEAIGLDWAALFPEPLKGHSYPAVRSRIAPAELLAIVSEEVTVAALIAADLLAEKNITEEDWTRLATAARRLGNARDFMP
jgi:hypothetical protein